MAFFWSFTVLKLNMYLVAVTVVFVDDDDDEVDGKEKGNLFGLFYAGTVCFF